MNAFKPEVTLWSKNKVNRKEKHGRAGKDRKKGKDTQATNA